MKKILYLTAICLFFSAFNHVKATHLAGGEIYYKHIGGPTNPFLYEITALIYRDMDGSVNANPDPGDPIDICFSSSCFSSFTLSFSPSVPGPGEVHPKSSYAFKIPSLDSCVNNSSSNFVDIGVFKWVGTATLSGVCTDWRISFGYNARNGDIDNLLDAGTENMYVEAWLNNTFGPNSSPQFISPAATAFCVVQPNEPPFVWVQQAIESDGDSVRITLDNPLDGNSCGPGTPIPYDLNRNPNYSPTNPITTHNNVFLIDESTGTFTFSPSTSEVAVINVVAEEYKFDPNILQWVNVGRTSRDLQCVITAACKNSVVGGPTVDVSPTTGITIEPVSTDSIYSNYDIPIIGNDSVSDPNGGYIINLPVIDYTCYDSIIQISFDIGVNCSSITPSDFRVIGPDGIVRPVTDVSFNCNTANNTRKIDLRLHRPLDVNGDFLMYIKNGNDGNTLTNQCGFGLADFFSMIIRVDDCPILDYDLKNVTVVDDKEIKIEWEADPNTFNPALFQQWRIYRAHNDNNFYPLTTLNDINARSFIDNIKIDEEAVDKQVYQYAIQMYINNIFRAPVGDLRSILLAVSHYQPNESVSLYWNKYDGFNEEKYEVYVTDANDFIWEKVTDLDSSTRYYRYDIPGNTGTYAMKVEAKDAQDPNYPYISESNWIYFDVFDDVVVIDEPEDPVIPNVMTPNNDSQNDRFYIKADGYPKISVAIHNRWGRLVFKDDNFAQRNDAANGWDGTDMNNGQPLVDGVYYYNISFNDPASGKNLDYQGSLTIMGGSN